MVVLGGRRFLMSEVALNTKREIANSAPVASPLDVTGLKTALRQCNIPNQLTIDDSSEKLDRLQNGPTRSRGIALRISLNPLLR